VIRRSVFPSPRCLSLHDFSGLSFFTHLVSLKPLPIALARRVPLCSPAHKPPGRSALPGHRFSFFDESHLFFLLFPGDALLLLLLSVVGFLSLLLRCSFPNRVFLSCCYPVVPLLPFPETSFARLVRDSYFLLAKSWIGTGFFHAPPGTCLDRLPPILVIPNLLPLSHLDPEPPSGLHELFPFLPGPTISTFDASLSRTETESCRSQRKKFAPPLCFHQVLCQSFFRTVNPGTLL